VEISKIKINVKKANTHYWVFYVGNIRLIKVYLKYNIEN